MRPPSRSPAIPGVLSVEPTDRDADSRELPPPDRPRRCSAAVQRGVTRLAADNDLTVIDNSRIREGLEDVFMRLVDTKERAA